MFRKGVAQVTLDTARHGKREAREVRDGVPSNLLDSFHALIRGYEW